MILSLFGYPKTGKTLLFNLLTEQTAEVSKFASSSQDFHLAVVNVPDERLERLAQLRGTPAVHARIEFLDTGAIAFGQANNTTFIDLLRRADGLIHVVRAFEDVEIPHYSNRIDPAADIEAIEEELKAVDFLTIEKRLERVNADIKKVKSKELTDELELLTRLKQFLESGRPLREMDLPGTDQTRIRGFQFLTRKPILHLINSDETSFNTLNVMCQSPRNHSATSVFAGLIEHELLQLEAEERGMFQQEFGLANYRYIKDNFVNLSYGLMGQISFFTLGDNETKAWTISSGSDAYTAAGKIHSDIQQGFIRAEVMQYQEFLKAESMSKAKQSGDLRLEGKQYIIQDGDIVQFRFNKP